MYTCILLCRPPKKKNIDRHKRESRNTRRHSRQPSSLRCTYTQRGPLLFCPTDSALLLQRSCSKGAIECVLCRHDACHLVLRGGPRPNNHQQQTSTDPLGMARLVCLHSKRERERKGALFLPFFFLFNLAVVIRWRHRWLVLSVARVTREGCFHAERQATSVFQRGGHRGQ